ncbi:MAG: hypothetical protein ACT4QC_18885 [Planctomycetaceae bacterium]
MGLVVCGLLAGCGGADRPALAPVSGVVRYDGEPIEKISVSFVPRKGAASIGVSDAEGKFRLTTFDENDGAILGNHAVTVMYLTEPVDPFQFLQPGPKGKPTNLPKRPKDMPSFPAKYRTPESTDLQATVNKGENVFMIDIARDKVVINR